MLKSFVIIYEIANFNRYPFKSYIMLFIYMYIHTHTYVIIYVIIDNWHLLLAIQFWKRGRFWNSSIYIHLIIDKNLDNYLSNSKRDPSWAICQIRPRPPVSIAAVAITTITAISINRLWNTSVTRTALIPPIVE